MNLKLKRLVRTSNSEQYALFDLDQLDAHNQPMTIGKLDMHYTGEGVYGTILFWDDATRELSPIRRENLIQALLEEIAQPMGVPNEFVVEFFAPTLNEYHVFHNLDRDELDRDELERDDSAESIFEEPGDLDDGELDDGGLDDGELKRDDGEPSTHNSTSLPGDSNGEASGYADPAARSSRSPQATQSEYSELASETDGPTIETTIHE